MLGLATAVLGTAGLACSSVDDFCKSVTANQEEVSISNCSTPNTQLSAVTYNSLGQFESYDFVARCDSNGKMAHGHWSQTGGSSCVSDPISTNTSSTDSGAPDSGAGAKPGMYAFSSRASRNVDILLMVDNSFSMRAMQTKLNAQLPTFMQVLQQLPGGLPDLHVAVVSSSMGGGMYSDVASCFPNMPAQDDRGKFQFAAHPAMGQASCPTPYDGEHYIKANNDGTKNNFTGGTNALAGVLACIGFLGDDGCGFEQPFASVQRALEKAQDPNDPDNGGFLRDDAYLAVVMLTNEDDCSMPPDSDLLATNQYDLSAPLGPLKSYRCNEFGHLCTYPDGHVDKPPRTLPNFNPPTTAGDDVTMMKCVSAADNGGPDNKLTKVKDFVNFLKGLKRDPRMVQVSVIGTMTPGAKDFPLAPYVVTATDNVVPDPSMPDPPRHEFWPSVESGCTNPDGSFGDPSPRHELLVQQFGAYGSFTSICDATYQQPFVQIADAIGGSFRPPCITVANLTTRADGTPDCQVASVTSSGQSSPLPNCNAGGWCGAAACTRADASTAKPCWDLDGSATCALGEAGFVVCRDPTCDQTVRSTQEAEVTVDCTLAP